MLAQVRATKAKTRRSMSSVGIVAGLDILPARAERVGGGDKGSGKSQGKGKGKSKGKGKLNSVEDCNWQEGWLDSGTSNREQSEEHAGGWWNEEHVDGWWKDEQTGSSSSAGWWTANDQTPFGTVQLKSTVSSRDTSNTIDGDKNG